MADHAEPLLGPAMALDRRGGVPIIASVFMSIKVRSWSTPARRHVVIRVENVGIRIENVVIPAADFVGLMPSEVSEEAAAGADILRPPMPAPEGARRRDIFYIGGPGARASRQSAASDRADANRNRWRLNDAQLSRRFQT